MKELVSPNTANYARGGARVFLRKSGDPAGQMHNFGNIVSNGVKLEVQNAEHVSGYSGQRAVDRLRTDVTKIVYTIEVDENTFENERLWLLGGDPSAARQEPSSVTDLAVADLIKVPGATTTPTFADLVAGRYYDTGKISIYDVVLKITGTPDQILAPYNADDDTGHYIVDAATGKIAFTHNFVEANFAAKISFSYHEISSKTFKKLDQINTPVVAEMYLVVEGGPEKGGWLDKWDIPKAYLVSSGDGKISADNDRTLTFEIHQTLHSTEHWGNHTRYTLGS